MQPVWCLSFEEPIVLLAEYWHDDQPWLRLWSNYIVLPESWRFLHG